MNIEKPFLSIITISLNAVADLERTILSVNVQNRRSAIEHIIIDGNSIDETSELLKTHAKNVETIVSEPDNGIYDAMNKGIQLAKADWIYFLNAGDVFIDKERVTSILEAQQDTDVIYSDVVVEDKNSTFNFETNFEQKKLNHQGFVYKKSLHTKFGPYAVVKGFTAADYLFFVQLYNLRVKKLNQPIALFKAGGLSSTVKAVNQKYCIDYLSGKVSASYLASILLLYPIYRYIKKFSSIFSR